MPTCDQTYIAITFADDTLGIMGFVTAEYERDGRVRWTRGDTPQAIDAEIARTAYAPEKLPIKGWRRIDPRELPEDRTYRDAWRDRGGKVEHDMPAARAIHLGALRHERARALETHDRDFMVAFDAWLLDGQKKTDALEALAIKRQALRDMPVTLQPAIDGAGTVEALKAIKLPE